MDDGSTDGSLDLLRVWAEKDARIKVFTQKNEGLNSALNFLIAKSKGLYIARMDVDDFSFPDRLSQQVAYLNNHASIDLVSTGAVHVDAEGSGFSAVIYPDSDDYYRKAILEDRFNPVYHGATMYRHSAIKKFMPHVYRLRYGQDYDLWFRMIASGSRFGTVQQVLYGYNWGSELQLNYEKNMCRTLQKIQIQKLYKAGMLFNDDFCIAELSS
jgi:glycosyltransferase involved in cell wall biosynthesis